MRYGNCTEQPQRQLSWGEVGVHPTGVPLTLRTCYGKHGPGKYWSLCLILSMWSIPLISLGWLVLNFEHMLDIPLQTRPLLKSSHKLLNQWICLLWLSWTLHVRTGYLSKGCRMIINGNHIWHTLICAIFLVYGSDKLVARCGAFEAAWMYELYGQSALALFSVCLQI